MPILGRGYQLPGGQKGSSTQWKSLILDGLLNTAADCLMSAIVCAQMKHGNKWENDVRRSAVSVFISRCFAQGRVQQWLPLSGEPVQENHQGEAAVREAGNQEGNSPGNVQGIKEGFWESRAAEGAEPFLTSNREWDESVQPLKKQNSMIKTKESLR